MRAITLTQPWATLVAIGAKKIETRGWSTSYRGPLAIHAAKGLGPVGGKRGFYDLCYSAPFLSALEPAMTGERDIAGFKVPYIDPGHLPLGAIVATCELVDCQMIGVLLDGTPAYMAYDEFPPVLAAVQEPERSFGDYGAGRYAWILTNIKPLPKPIHAKGALSLWEWEQDI